jgi:hypothetical protein
VAERRFREADPWGSYDAIETLRYLCFALGVGYYAGLGSADHDQKLPNSFTDSGYQTAGLIRGLQPLYDGRGGAVDAS